MRLQSRKAPNYISFRPPICSLVLIKIPEKCFLRGFLFLPDLQVRTTRESGGTQVHAYVNHRPISKCRMTRMCDYQYAKCLEHSPLKATHPSGSQ